MTGEHSGAGKCALIVGHPGHELRVWGWMRQTRPAVAVVTDGSGHAGESRLDLSREICEQAAAVPSALFGLTTDRCIYDALLAGDSAFFLGLADTLATWLVREGIDTVAGDAIEGYNPTHDLCRVLINRAVRMASARRPLANYAFDLTGPPGRPASADGPQLELSDADLAHKIELCRRYGAAAGGILPSEIDALLEQHGARSFAHEYLVPADAWADLEGDAGYRPFYEAYGEQQVADGHYQHVIRHDVHVRPIVRVLQQ